VAAGQFRSPAQAAFGPPVDYSRLPAFCRVAGTIRATAESDVRFELWLPEQWNGKFMQTGNGGAAGAIVYDSLVDPLLRGYAVTNTDTGHQGAGGDFAWAIGEPQRLIDYQYRAVHELTLAGKALAALHYGRQADRSYWVGCSTGGRQGLKEAQRYPDDYDGIVAGAPASNWSALMGLSVNIQRNLGEGGLGVDKLGVLKEAAIAACDAADGVADRVITNFATCDFDPARLQCAAGAATAQCLSPTEVAAADRISAGGGAGSGEDGLPGTGVGSEPLWAAYASPQFSIGTNYFRSVVTNDASWDPATFDVDRDLARAEAVDNGAAKAMNPDLSQFTDRGGKLITYHGTTDGLIPFANSVNYYEAVVDELGRKADDSVRLYLVPGMDHCSGGDGAYEIDWLTPLEQWVEQGEEPGALAATHPAVSFNPPGAPPAPASKPFTRPVCPYPQVPTYRGSGDVADAASFECTEPAQEPGPVRRLLLGR
jgi:feruloyl esterase